MEPSVYEPPGYIRRDKLLQILCSKSDVVQIPAAHPSYYVSDGSTASIYSLFQGKLWELPLSSDLLWRERAEAGAMDWDAGKFIDELIVSMKKGGMVFDDTPKFFFYYFHEGKVDFEGDKYALALSSTLPGKFALMLRLIQPEPVKPEPAAPSQPDPPERVRRKRKSKKQKVKEYIKIRKRNLRF